MAAGKRERVVFQMSASKKQHLSHSLSLMCNTARFCFSAAMGRNLKKPTDLNRPKIDGRIFPSNRPIIINGKPTEFTEIKTDRTLAKPIFHRSIFRWPVFHRLD